VCCFSPFFRPARPLTRFLWLASPVLFRDPTRRLQKIFPWSCMWPSIVRIRFSVPHCDLIILLPVETFFFSRNVGLSHPRLSSSLQMRMAPFAWCEPSLSSEYCVIFNSFPPFEASRLDPQSFGVRISRFPHLLPIFFRSFKRHSILLISSLYERFFFPATFRGSCLKFLSLPSRGTPFLISCRFLATCLPFLIPRGFTL